MLEERCIKIVFYVYIVRCNNSKGTFYTGYTNDLERRLKEHNKGYTKFIRGKTPVTLVYFERRRNIRTARQREREIKRLSRKKKMELIKKHK